MSKELKLGLDDNPNIKLGACGGAAYKPKAPTFIVGVKPARTFVVPAK